MYANKSVGKRNERAGGGTPSRYSAKLYAVAGWPSPAQAITAKVNRETGLQEGPNCGIFVSYFCLKILKFRISGKAFRCSSVLQK